MTPFKAFLIEEVEGRTRSSFVSLDESRLDAGEVTIRVAYASVNYKDALAATGTGRIIRRFPCVGGIDFSGVVDKSSDPRFKAGDPVVVTGFDVGIAHHGGYAEFARVPADWVIPLPDGFSLLEAIALGTAGFTAALATIRMEENGLVPGNGPVVVSGATGGVGGLAVDMLAGRGYQVTALTGKEAEFDYLKRLGATDVMFRSTLDLSRIRPLDKALWAGAVDNLGGDVLAWMASTMKPFGTIASIGLAENPSFNTTVMPFILRGVSLLGIESVHVASHYRKLVWQRLGSDLRPRHLLEMTHTIGFEDLPGVFDSFLKGKARGRVVVELAGT
jgi:putative YhdH/YhfP family quinone oxidoreductase